MSRYLVTGTAGFIGAKVAQFLLEDGHQVVGIDNLNDAYDVRLKEWRLAQISGRRGFAFHRMDVTDRQGLAALFAEAGPFDAVLNLAARAGVRASVIDPWSYMETNATGTLNLLDLCRQHAVEKFVLSSTSSLYGDNNLLPYREDMDASRPLSPYAASKGAAEALCHTYHSLHGLDVTILRYFTVYGPAGRPDMAPFRFTQWIREGRPLTLYGDGSQRRDFTYIDDVARGTIAALRPLGYEVINLGSDTPVTISGIIHLIEKLTATTAVTQSQPRHPADAEATWADISKAERLLGWRPQVPYTDGFAALVRWYDLHRAWARDIATN